MFKKAAAIVLSLALVSSLMVGCGAKGTSKSGTTTKKIKVGLTTSEGGLNDKSFNQSADTGIKRAVKDFGVDYKAVESMKKDDFQPNLQALISNNSDLIFGIGFQMGDDLDAIAKKNPNKKFAIVDTTVNEKNVVSLVFREQEGSFLMGVIAGKMTKSNKIGFVGGMNIDSINKFAAGYIAGAKTVNPKIQVEEKYVNSYTDTNMAEEIAKTLYNDGCDIVYHAAGGSGVGVFKAAKEMTSPSKQLWAIGVDMDQAETVPEYADVILTSMVKRVDNATYQVVKDLTKGKFEGGKTEYFGLKENGVDIAPSSKKHVPADILTLVDKYKDAIKTGKIKVPETIKDANAFKGEELK